MAGTCPPRPSQKGQGRRIKRKNGLCRKIFRKPANDVPRPVIDLRRPVIALTGEPAKHFGPRIADEYDKLRIMGNDISSAGFKPAQRRESRPPDAGQYRMFHSSLFYPARVAHLHDFAWQF